MNVEVVEQPARRLGTVRHVGHYHEIGRAFGQLGPRLGAAAGSLFAGGAAMVAVFHDDPDRVPAGQLRSDAAIVVPEGFALPDGLIEQRLDGGRYATTVHVGPYEQLGQVWQRLRREWLPSSGERAAARPSFELYVNDPGSTPKEQLRTQLFLPLA